MQESAHLTEQAMVTTVGHQVDEPIQWRCVTDLECRDGTTGEVVRTEHVEGNLLTYGGASALWDTLIGAGNTATFSAANAKLGVGDSSTAAAATQTDLQATTNKIRKAMDGGYPQHTDGTTVGVQAIVFRSTYTISEANFTWNEWGLFNAASAGRMLNRKVASLGAKTSAQEWTLTVSLSLV